MRVVTGHQQSWPGVALAAPGGRWDLTPFGQVALRVRNAGTNVVTVHCRVDNPGAEVGRQCRRDCIQGGHIYSYIGARELHGNLG